MLFYEQEKRIVHKTKKTKVAQSYTVPLDFNCNVNKPTKKLVKAIAELKNGDLTHYESLEDLIKAMK